jgi:hypothetical protein
VTGLEIALAGANLLAALATGGATVALARYGYKQNKQAAQLRYDQARPVLYPVALSSSQGVIDPCGNVDWRLRDTAILEVHNAGTGAAFNVAALLLGPPAPLPGQDDRFTGWHAMPIPPGPPGGQLFTFGVYQIRLDGGSVIDPAASIDCEGTRHHLHAPAPASAPTVNTGVVCYILRLTLTYEDVYRRRHAAIFDCTRDQRWHRVATCEDIKQDLHALDAAARAPGLRAATTQHQLPPAAHGAATPGTHL